MGGEMEKKQTKTVLRRLSNQDVQIVLANQADSNLKTSIVEFHDYQDSEGKMGTNKGMFALSINKAIKKEFNAPVSDLDGLGLILLTELRENIAFSIKRAMETGKTRRETKDFIKRLIKFQAEQYKQKQAFLQELSDE